MARLAWTGPNRLSMPISSMASGLPPSCTDQALERRRAMLKWDRPQRAADPVKLPSLHRASIVGHVVVDLHLARLDVRGRLVDGLLHVGRDQRLVVLVERPADAAFSKTERVNTRRELAVLGLLEG